MRAREVGTRLLDLLFPPRCPWCGGVKAPGRPCCEEKLAGLRLPELPLDRAPYGGQANPAAPLWAVFRYEQQARGAVLRFKLQNEPELAEPLGDEMAARAAACGIFNDYDVIVPVPVSPKTQRRRGYNQSGLLAGRLAQKLDAPLETGCLRKTKETKPQRELDGEARRHNILGVYAVADPGPIAGKRVLLVDDVLTTGSTVAECARTLLQAGAAHCGAYCLCAVEGRGPAELSG